MRRFLLTLAVALASIAVVVIVRTVSYPEVDQGVVAPVFVSEGFPLAPERLASALRYPTVATQDTRVVDTTAFLGLHDLLAREYPAVFRQLAVEKISDLSLLISWTGSSPDLSPALVMGHMDVVPAGADSLWVRAPFGGVMADGFVWGRGALDDKIGVIAALEAVDRLLSEGFRPERTIYLAFGHDEETGGERGAAVIADTLASRHPDGLEFVLDEGGFVGYGLLDGLDAPVALVGIAEKGYLSVEIEAKAPGGHSSAPPSMTSVSRVARAVARLSSDPFPARIDGATRALFDHVGPHMSTGRRVVFSNLWLFEPILKRILISDAGSAAMVRTTTAATMIEGGVKENVLPTSARAVVNFRILPGESTGTVMERVRRVVDDEDLDISPVNVFFDPSPVSEAGSDMFRRLAKAIRETVHDDGLVVSPYLVPGATDSRYYVSLSENVYRFLPIRVDRGALETIHGAGERVEVAGVRDCAAFVYQLLRATAR